MSRSSHVAILATTLLAVSISTARGQVQISFDENGHGMGPAGPLPFGVNTSPPLAFQTLFYVLPFQVAPGDVLLFENPQHTLVSDMIRFSGNQVFFFSDKEPGETNPDLADVDLIPNPILGFVSLDETPFTEGNNGAVYTPVAGGPGDPGFPVQYNIISDAVPEPTSLALAVMGAVVTSAFLKPKQFASPLHCLPHECYDGDAAATLTTIPDSSHWRQHFWRRHRLTVNGHTVQGGAAVLRQSAVS